MTASPPATWHQMIVSSPEGREEALWVEQHGRNAYRVLNVPVWAYGISIGTVVEAEPVEGDRLRFRRLVRESSGGTLRVIVSPGQKASDIYLQRIIPDARQRKLFIGPATFFNPRLVALNIRDRKEWWPKIGSYFDELVKEGVLEQWEVADPDQYAEDHKDDEGALTEAGNLLVHQLPIDGVEGQHVS